MKHLDLQTGTIGSNPMGHTVWTMTETHMEEETDWDAWGKMGEQARHDALFNGGKLPKHVVPKSTTSKPFVF